MRRGAARSGFGRGLWLALALLGCGSDPDPGPDADGSSGRPPARDATTDGAEPPVEGGADAALDARSPAGEGGADARADAAAAGEAGIDGRIDAGEPVAGRCRHHDPLRQPFFGDTHVHTTLSLDANLQGTRLRPADAYRFARGERVDLPPYDADGVALRTLRLAQPLDFAAVTDHAEFLGHVLTCTEPGRSGFDSVACLGYRAAPDVSFVGFNAATAAGQGSAASPAPCAGGACEDAVKSAWDEIRSAAAAAQDGTDACAFSSFVGYEWTGNPATQNLHRNVLFGSADVPDRPTSYFDAQQEEELWRALARDCERGVDGCQVLTIPHNSNLSAGLMFETVDATGAPFDAEYARERARMEPLVEIFQHKGSSECLSPMGEDEACGFEQLPYDTLSGANLDLPAAELRASDTVRDALLQGLSLQAKLGENPFAYGFVASTDTHLGTPGAVDEERFPGHGGADFAARDRLPPGLVDSVWFNPGGLAVLWAEENSRGSLFASMRRREAYGTSGPRIRLRFFAGFGYEAGACDARDFAARGYAGGVPMGGELSAAASGGAPRFLVRASRDPGDGGAPLSHVEIVKGWLDGETLRTRVVQVAGEVVPLDAVDAATCEVPEDVGVPELCADWEDDQYDPAQPAFYYARAFEVPSCRWHARACLAAAVDCAAPGGPPQGFSGCCNQDVPRVQRERAWSSPIWLTDRGGQDGS